MLAVWGARTFSAPQFSTKSISGRPHVDRAVFKQTSNLDVKGIRQTFLRLREGMWDRYALHEGR
jgi:hypothetical protein